MRHPLNRRSFLRSAGVCLALPALDAMRCKSFGDEDTKTPRRAVFICTSLGLHGPSLFPTSTGRDFDSTPYLDLLQEHRDRFTLFSGLSHPEQAGRDGHSSQMTWLTAAPNPGLGGFRNTISVDQLIAEKFGYVTRFPSLTLSSGGATSQSYNRNGVMVPAEHSHRRLFEKMFLQGSTYEIALQRQRLSEGQSVLDTLGQQTKRLRRRISSDDRERLDEYFQSIRQTENRFAEATRWLDRPKPKVDEKPPTDIEENEDIIGRTRLLFDLIPLIVQTDSTRVISVLIEGRSQVPPVDGVKLDHHNLSHHGQDADKIAQLQKIETAIVKSLANLLQSLQQKSEGVGSLLDNTMTLFGSNLGNANSHDWKNLPILVAGGPFSHGSHVAFDKANNKPLCNLFVSLLHELNLPIDQFGSSNGRLEWS